MFGKLKSLLNDKKLIALKNDWIGRQKKVNNVKDYVDELIDHLNKVAKLIAIKDKTTLTGKIFRIGITHLVDNKLVPLPLVKSDQLKKLFKIFIDQFLIIPVKATSLGVILESDNGDTITDMEKHLAERKVSVSSQIALKWGIKSNMRMPYSTLKNKGIIFFSSDVTNFFNEELFDYIESIIHDVEAYLNITNDFDALMKTQESLVEKEGDVFHSKNLLRNLKLFLEEDTHPFEDKIKYEQRIFTTGKNISGNLLNLWKLDENRLAILLLESDVNLVDSVKMSLYLRGMFLKEAKKKERVVDVVTELEKYFWSFLSSEPSLTSTSEAVSAFYGVLNLKDSELTYSNAGFIHPLICRKDEGTVDILENTGLYFGSMDQSFEERKVTLKKGERFFIATSNLLEIVNKKHNALGGDSLKKVISESHNKNISEVCHLIYNTADEIDKNTPDKFDAIFAAIEIL